MTVLEKVRNGLDRSHSPYHAIALIADSLREKGYCEIYEQDGFILEPGKGYFLRRNGSSLIAFFVPPSPWKGLHIVASHSDSPTFRLKHNPAVNQGGEIGLRLEGYGGTIMSTWFDRPLSFAGRIMVEKGGKVEPRLFDVDEDLLIIPNLCIHFNRSINEGHAYNIDSEIIPLMGKYEEGFSWNAFLAEKAKLEEGERILDEDLFLYPRSESTLLGKEKEYLCSPKEDNLTSAFSSSLALLDASIFHSLPLCVIFDNEEVGSSSFQGADSDFLVRVIKRILTALGRDYETEVASSILLSVDNAHAKHPNYPAVFERTSEVKLNGGVVLKYNASLRYTTDALSSSIVRLLAEKLGVNIQTFSNRPDIRGGGTLGNISMSQLSILSADIGLAQLAMHSSYETMGAKDIESMHTLLKGFFEADISFVGEKIEIK